MALFLPFAVRGLAPIRLRENPKQRQAYGQTTGDHEFHASVESTTAKLCFLARYWMFARPNTLRSRSAGTFMGPGAGVAPGAGCGNAVDMAVWNVTFPSTFCITW